jgi:hypothetical protein
MPTHAQLSTQPALYGLLRAFLRPSLVALFAITAACTGAEQAKTTKPTLTSRGPVTIQKFDLNGDGKPDAWRHYKQIKGERVLTMKRFDFNFDGRIDLKRHYTDEGQVDYDEMDMDFDGRTDLVSRYENNKLVRKELNTRGDEKPEVFKEYKDGELYYMEGDKDGDGKLDMWSYFKKGKMVREGYDRNGDGQPDDWKHFD